MKVIILAAAAACAMDVPSTKQEIFVTGIARRVAHAQAVFDSETASCEPTQTKYFLFSLNKKTPAGRTLAQIREAGAVPIEAHVSVAERGYSFPIDASQDDAAIQASLRSNIVAYVEETLKNAAQPLPEGFNTPQSARRNEQEKTFSEKELVTQRSSPAPLVNGWLVRAACTDAIRLRESLSTEILAIELSSETRRGMAIPLEIFPDR